MWWEKKVKTGLQRITNIYALIAIKWIMKIILSISKLTRCMIAAICQILNKPILDRIKIKSNLELQTSSQTDKIILQRNCRTLNNRLT